MRPPFSDEVARQVLSYFVRNPQAADSLEGIARWRLLEERLHQSLRQTEAAIAWLVKKGYLQEIRTAESACLYRLGPDRQQEAVRFLSRRRKPRGDENA